MEKQISGPKPKILIVGNKRPASAMLARRFENLNCDVLRAHSRQEGLYLTLKECPDFIVFDLEMSEVDGMEMLSQVRKFDDRYGEIHAILSDETI